MISIRVTQLEKNKQHMQAALSLENTVQPPTLSPGGEETLLSLLYSQ